MVNSVEAVLQARKVYHDLHKAYGYVKVSNTLQNWLDENNAPRYEVSLAFKELGWLYGFVEEDKTLSDIHSIIKRDSLGVEIEEPVPAKIFTGAENENALDVDTEPEEAVYDEPEEDVVNHPKHYKLDNGIEAIDLMEMTSTAPEFVGHLRNTALKYIIRAGHKDPSKYVQDLDKAKWYITKLQEFHNKCEDKEY